MKPSFWLALAVSELVFGIAVFAVTRAYYLRTAPAPVPAASALAEPTPLAWPGLDAPAVAAAPSDLAPPSVGMSAAQLAEQADAFFANGRYAEAAELYARLAALAPDSADIRNNLGLTLHYLGRSEEAIASLQQAVALDPQHQRSWLTLGFVNSQLDRRDAAREALTRAIETGSDPTIRKAAEEMLDALP